MDALKILGKVYYKQIVTDAYKTKAKKEIQAQMDEIDRQLEEFDKQMSKTMTELTLKAHPQTEALRQQFNMERDKIAVYKEQFAQALAAVDQLENGTEVDTGDGEFITELKVGDSFSSTLNYDLVIEDDVVKEIRKK